MLMESRHEKILNLLRTQGSVQVAELEDRLVVSDMTIRRDLRQMAEAGLLRRVHGGAVLVGAPEAERSFQRRQVDELPRKLAIAAIGPSLIEPGQSIFLDGSTTCHELATRLANDLRIRVVTDSLAVLLELQNRTELEVTSLGGTLAKDGNTLDGPLAVQNAEQISVDVCFFSAYGFTPHMITNTGLVGALVKRTMIRNAQKCVLLADATKFQSQGFIELCRWTDVDVLVSDSLSPDQLRPIAEQGVEVRIAEIAAEEAV